MNSCILCGSNKFNNLFIIDKKEIVKCNKCGLAKTKNFKLPDYSKYHRDKDYKKFESHFKNIFTKRFNIAKNFVHSGTVLDIGTSTGTMLDIFKNEGWETWGVEPSNNALIAQAKGHKIFHTTFENTNIPSGKFDLVIINHTLEHFKNPLEVLIKTNKILKKGGIVLVDVPNFNSLKSAFLRSRWKYLLPKEHAFHFTPETLSKLFEKAEFKVISIKTRSGLFEFANPLREIFESLFTFKKRFFTNLLNFPIDLISTLLKKGDSLSVVGEK